MTEPEESEPTEDVERVVWVCRLERKIARISSSSISVEETDQQLRCKQEHCT